MGARAGDPAWLGPAIGPTAFEGGGEVRDAFMAERSGGGCGLRPFPTREMVGTSTGWPGCSWQSAGVTAVYGGEFCTFGDGEQFYSYRRDGQTGRMASIIWLAE